MKEIDFSVIIPVYNVESYIRQCVDSVLSQESVSLEILLIDDGSTDRSGSICDAYAQKHDCVTVQHQINKGAATARNVGIELATGKYIIFLDSDDWWKNTNVLYTISERLLLTQADVLCFNYEKIEGVKKAREYFRGSEDMPSEIKPSDSFTYVIEHNLWIASVGNKVVNRKLFENEKLRFREGISSEDVDWCLRLALHAESFDYISEVVFCYRQRNLSVSHMVDNTSMLMLYHNIEYCLSILNRADNDLRSKQLHSYVGFYYGILLYGISTVEDKRERMRLLSEVSKHQKLLMWSQNPKVKLLCMVNRVLGLRFTMELLVLYSKRRSRKGKVDL